MIEKANLCKIHVLNRSRSSLYWIDAFNGNLNVISRDVFSLSFHVQRINSGKPFHGDYSRRKTHCPPVFSGGSFHLKSLIVGNNKALFLSLKKRTRAPRAF